MHPSVILLSFYGLFLILCGILSVSFIGKKAKTALISGGTSGALSLLIAFFMSQMKGWSFIAGILLTLALVVVFAWRATKTLFALFKMIQEADKDLKVKGIAFLIISLMCVVSITTFAMQLVFYYSN
jgi:uncharacterized membrane protein (UPF0136 family)